MGDRSHEIEHSTNWVTLGIETRLEPGCSRAFTAVDDYKQCSKDDLFYLRHPRLSDDLYAKLAFDLFKKTKEFESVPELTNYQLVEALGSSRALYKVPPFESFKVLDWCHVCFLISHNGLERLLCFAELVDFGYGDHFILNSISFVKPHFCDGTSYGCGFCPPTRDFPHPPHVGYTAGWWEYNPIKEEYQKKLAFDFQRKVIEQEHKQGNTSCIFHLCEIRSDAYPRVKEPVYDPSRYTPMLLEEGYAVIALDQINRKEGADYELVDTWFAHCEILPGKAGFYMWCHVAFAVKPRDGSASWIYFFAEMKDEGERKFVLNDYCKFDQNDPGLMEGCDICPTSRDLPHPPYGCFRYTLSRSKLSD